MTNLIRCAWGASDPLYVKYHDEEWGVPLKGDDSALFERITLEGAQAGLSWITILRKRENFRKAFDKFDPKKIARYDEKKLNALMQDEGIIRNRAKILSARQSARAWLEMQEKGPGFSKFLWDFVDGEPKINRLRSRKDIKAETPVSKAMSKELKARGFNFCGPTIMYSLMQATGMVNDHLTSCYRHPELSK